jgi:hypothetical protein
MTTADTPLMKIFGEATQPLVLLTNPPHGRSANASVTGSTESKPLLLTSTGVTQSFQRRYLETMDERLARVLEAQSASLDKDAKSASQQGSENQQQHSQNRRNRRFYERDFLRLNSKLKRVRLCGWAKSAQGQINVVMKNGVAHYTGLQSCGSVWACPVCAPKIREGRAVDIEKAVIKHLEAGGGIYFVTYTAPHKPGAPLQSNMEVLDKAYKYTWSGRKAKDFKELTGQIGTIKARDCTVTKSVANPLEPRSWHEHFHTVIFTNEPASDEQRQALEEYVLEYWRKGLERQKVTGFKDEFMRVDIGGLDASGKSALGKYLSKITDEGQPNTWGIGREAARSDLKKGKIKGDRWTRTPFEILGGVVDTGDLEDLPIWLEWEHSTRGKQFIRWSVGLRQLLLGDEPEKSDEELAAEAVGGDTLLLLTDAWPQIRSVIGLRAGILEAAEKGGVAGVYALLQKHLPGMPLPPPPSSA